MFVGRGSPLPFNIKEEGFMYKKQLILQKVVCFAMLAMSAIIFLYTLGIMTEIYDTLYFTMSDPNDIYNVEDGLTKVSGAWIYYEMQNFNGNFTNLSIALILVTLVLFVTGTHSRRKYYIGNYIAVGLSTVANVAFAAWSLINISMFRAKYLEVDFEALKAFWERRNKPEVYTDSTFWFDISYVLFGILIAISVLLIVNTILKVKLMEQEKSRIGMRKDGRLV